MQQPTHGLVSVYIKVFRQSVMAYIGWPKFIEAGQYVEYFAIILVTLIVIFLLRVVLRKKERLKRERQQQQDLSE